MSDSQIIKSILPATTGEVLLLGTFTVEALDQTLSFWHNKLGWNHSIAYGPYNQIFQQLAEPGSQFYQNNAGTNVLLIRLEDWKGVQESEQQEQESISSNCTNFLTLVQQSVEASSANLIVVMCASSPEFCKKHGQYLAKQESELINQLSAITMVYPFHQQYWESVYPIAESYSAQGDEIGHMPFTEEGYCQLANIIARSVNYLINPPKKVVVLDCDETLWGGVCGEDGASGIVLDEGRLFLHQYMLEQRNKGMLLCIASKNVEEDVDAVFASRSDMLLTKNDITLSKVNWSPKSQNILELAQELNLGVDSFIFVDDNPVEIAEVNAALPGVTTLCIPKDSKLLKSFLEHAWVFDQFKVTQADKVRAQQYSENVKRDESLSSSTSLSDFISGLNLEIDVQPITGEDIERCAQLTQRTNQFNFTTLRKNESEVKHLVGAENSGCLKVNVKDRFGDYGLVGFAIYFVDEKRLLIDSFLLSCRVLSRGVEYALMSELGRIAVDLGISDIEIPFDPTPKNLPAYNFYSALGEIFQKKIKSNTKQSMTLDAAGLAKLSFDPDLARKNDKNTFDKSKKPEKKLAASNDKSTSKSIQANYDEIAKELQTVEQIMTKSAEGAKLNRNEELGSFAEPEGDLETLLAVIWGKTAQIDRVGRNDDFFALGGTSLQATQAISRIAREFEIRLSLKEFFANASIAKMALYVEAIILAEIENGS